MSHARLRFSMSLNGDGSSRLNYGGCSLSDNLEHHACASDHADAPAVSLPQRAGGDGAGEGTDASKRGWIGGGTMKTGEGVGFKGIQAKFLRWRNNRAEVSVPWRDRVS